MLRFKPVFSLSFTFIKRLFSSSSLSSVAVASSAGLRLWLFLLAILIPHCDSSSLAFLMMYFAYKFKTTGWQYTALTFSFPSFEPVSCSMSSSDCCFLTCILVSQETGKVVSYSHPFKGFPVCCDPHSQSVVNEAEADVFFWNFLTFSNLGVPLYPFSFALMLTIFYIKLHYSNFSDFFLWPMQVLASPPSSSALQTIWASGVDWRKFGKRQD